MLSRRLASPAEVMAALSDAVADPTAITLRMQEWPELHLIRMAFRGAGSCVVAPIGFHAVNCPGASLLASGALPLAARPTPPAPGRHP